MSGAIRNRMDCQHQERRYGCSDDELACKICLGVYSQTSPGQLPRILQCHHTFCESCLLYLADLRAQKRRRWKQVHEEGSFAGSLKCPLCKCRTSLGPASVYGLPVNSTALQHSGRMSGLRSQNYGLVELHDLRPRCANKVASAKRNSRVSILSCGTTGNRVFVQPRFDNFHPPPREEEDLWELSRSRGGRALRFADEGAWSTEEQHDCSSRHDVGGLMDQDHDGFDDFTSTAVFVGQFGQQNEALGSRQGSFSSPSSIDCACDGRLVIVDSDSDTVQIFARNGDYLSSFRVVGAVAACFIAGADGRGELLALATNSGVSICDHTGRVDKHLPIGTDIVAVAALRHGTGVFVAAHHDRITVCDRYKPTALLRCISCVRPVNAPIGHPGVQFTDIASVASTATSRLYVVDAAAVLAIDVDTGTLLESFSPGRLLRQPCGVAVDLVTGSVLVCGLTSHRVMQCDADGGRRRCVAELTDDGGKCVALAAGPRGVDGHQFIYIVYCCPGFAQIRIYQI